MATVLSRPADTGGDSVAVTPKSVLCPLNFVVVKKFVLNIR